MKSLNRQTGVVLFFALILLIVMTVIGVALAVNAGQSLRMAGAGAERIEAKATADGGLATVFNETAPSFWATMTTSGAQTVLGSSAFSLPKGETPANVSCQRTEAASGTNLISCRRVEVSNSVTYGRSGLGSITVTQGIEQEVLNGSGS
ncbi:pilus assembly protein PilX [Shewanella mangrovi]|uniref:Pilus assembly protein PilX n=1 Tax=Shewanella mangrovi TaxID=1515746 RepID=A0A094JGC8_9GAMM|nr:pilus assembly PilX N-terminal domain-containing protein [Shewanella mangrovi]KFZ38267.1 pilus assembly protein PilX [Shewanella mangrovi]